MPRFQQTCLTKFRQAEHLSSISRPSVDSYLSDVPPIRKALSSKRVSPKMNCLIPKFTKISFTTHPFTTSTPSHALASRPLGSSQLPVAVALQLSLEPATCTPQRKALRISTEIWCQKTTLLALCSNGLLAVGWQL